MTNKEEFISCVHCGESLFYEPVAVDEPIDIGGDVFTLDLSYCPNNKCPRYELYTREHETRND